MTEKNVLFDLPCIKWNIILLTKSTIYEMILYIIVSRTREKYRANFIGMQILYISLVKSVTHLDS